METLDAGGSRPLSIIGGVLGLDFANRMDDPGGPAGFDYLGDAIRAAAWAANRGLRAPPSEWMRTSVWTHNAQVGLDLQRLHELRQAIHAGFTTAADGQPFPMLSGSCCARR
jgi:hypothetical protein